jgi:hypothetical protein
MRVVLFAVGILFTGSCSLWGHLYLVRALRSPNRVQRLFLYGDYHAKVSADITALERKQLGALLTACKSYQKSIPRLLVLAEDPVRTYGYSGRILDREKGVLPGLLNQLDTYKIPALSTINIETRLILLVALYLFYDDYFPVVCIDNPVLVAEQHRRDVTTFTIGQLFEEIETRLMAIMDKYLSIDTQPDAVSKLIDDAISAYDALDKLVLRDATHLQLTTSLLRYAIDLACKDVASGRGISLTEFLQKEATALVDDYATLSRDVYHQRVFALSEVWKKVRDGTDFVMGTRRRQILAALVVIGDALVELEAFYAILKAPQDATTIVAITGGDHARRLTTLLIAAGFEADEKGSEELAYNQALAPSVFDVLHQPIS